MKVKPEIIGVILLAAIFVYIIVPKAPPVPAGVDAFADCLTSKGVELYTTSTCPHCANQKALFGSALSKLRLYTCDDTKDNARCVSEGIQSVPTWKINGEKSVGVKSLAELATLTGCSLG